MGGAQGAEVAKGAVVLAGERVLHAVIAGERAVGGLERFGGEVGAGFGVELVVGGVEGGAGGVDGDVERGGFEGGDTAETPGDGDHLVDEVALGLVGGDEALVVLVAEGGEGFGALVLEEDGLGVEAVGGGVAG